MTQPKTFHELIGFDLGTQEVGWTDRDAILYALACGARADELDLVYERDLKPLPGLASALGLWAVERCGDLGLYDRKKSLHVSQKIVMHAPMPRNAAIPSRARVSGVWDKGKATIVDIEVETELFSVGYSIFLPGVGNWGGPSASSPASGQGPGDLGPVAQYQTHPEQAVLYRLTGDLHPVHVDPEVAKGYGFERPILHGLCTLGIVLRELGRVFGSHPAHLSFASARLSAPVIPGDLLTIRAAEGQGGVHFEAASGDRVVLKDGVAKFGG